MSLRMALLGLLAAEGPASGYGLTKSFGGSLNHVWQASHSQVYPELTRMVEAGLVTVSEDGEPRGKKCYTVTEAGRAELEHWLTEVEPSRVVRNEVALRAFLLSILEPAQAAALAEREIEVYRHRTAQLQELRDALFTASDPVFGRYAADLGVRIAAAIGEWAQVTAEELRKEAVRRGNTPESGP